MIWKHYRPNRYGRRNMNWPSLVMRSDLRGLNWDYVLGGTSGPVQAAFPPINVYEGEDGIIVTAEIPGIQTEDIEIRPQEGLRGKSGQIPEHVITVHIPCHA